MNTQLEEVQKQARMLSPEERAYLARTLLEELDTAAEMDFEAVWLDECQRRYAAYKRGDVASSPGDEAIARIRERLK